MRLMPGFDAENDAELECDYCCDAEQGTLMNEMNEHLVCI